MQFLSNYDGNMKINDIKPYKINLKHKYNFMKCTMQGINEIQFQLDA